MVETGVKAHRATQKSSSLGETLSLVLSWSFCCNYFHPNCSVSSPRQESFPHFYHAIESGAICAILMFITLKWPVNKGQSSVFIIKHRRGDIELWIEARRSSCSFALLSNSFMLSYYSAQVSVSLRVSGSLLPVHSAELATKNTRSGWKERKITLCMTLFFSNIYTFVAKSPVEPSILWYVTVCFSTKPNVEPWPLVALRFNNNPSF